MKSPLPKVLQPLAGRALVRHVIDTAHQLGAASIHLVYGHGGERVREALHGESLQWALQAEQLGTGHAVMQAASGLRDDDLALILYGDVPLIRRETLAALIDLAGPKSLALLTVELANPTGYGRIVRDAKGRVQKIVEEKDASARVKRIREGNTGVMAVPAKLLKRWLGKLRNDNAQKEYYLTDIIAMAVKDRIKVTPLVATDESEVLGINDKVQLAEAEAAYRQRRARELMVAGATLIDPARIDVRGEVSLGSDVLIEPNVILEGRVSLGDRVRIGANTILRDVTIGADTEVFANSVLEKAEVGTNCRIGPFARLRPGAKLAADVHVGNWVEVKNTSLGVGSKANHLTYLGDAEIGAGVNVGAGTVTCNYDGVNKFQTRIDDGAFIGSGSMLVAPVRVGKGATIGAGSTITRDAPDDRLTVARARQSTIDGWTRPVKATSKKK